MACRMDVSSQLEKLNEEADSLSKQINELYADKKKEADQTEKAEIQTRISKLEQEKGEINDMRKALVGQLAAGGTQAPSPLSLTSSFSSQCMPVIKACIPHRLRQSAGCQLLV